jgi:NAD(P)-dependent dehydrogenase (short-subunit alcohol dehydrogenase family)
MGWFSNGQCLSDARLDGKTAIITGASSGIGKVTALDFAKRGARVIMACRDLEKAAKAAQEIEEALKNSQNVGVLIIKKLDLSSFESVRKFSKEIIDTEPYVHLLINNGGIYLNYL